MKKKLQPRVLNETSEVTKSKALIFAKSTKNQNLSLAAQRALLALFSVVKPGEDETTFLISGRDVAILSEKSPNVVGQQFKEIAESSKELLNYTLSILEEDGNYLDVNLFSSTKYFKGERVLRVSVDQFFMPYLRGIKENYSISYNAGGPMRFTSEYSLALFDIMNYYLDEGGHYFTMQETRSLFNISDEKIHKTSVLNQRVIKKALNDINTFTNLDVTCEQNTLGQKIIGYHFKVKRKPGSGDDKPTVDEDALLLETLCSPPLSVNKRVLDKLVKKYGMPSIRLNYEYTKMRRPENFAPYFCDSVKNGHGEQWAELKQLQQVKKDYGVDRLAELEGQISLLPEEQTIEVKEEELSPMWQEKLHKVRSIKKEAAN